MNDKKRKTNTMTRQQQAALKKHKNKQSTTGNTKIIKQKQKIKQSK